MKNELSKKVYDKLYQEYEDFIQKIEGLPFKKVIENAYSITVRQEFLDMFYFNDSFSNRQLKALLEIPNVLDYLYNCWIRTDGNLFTIISESLQDKFCDLAEDYTDNLLLKMKKNNNFNLFFDISNVLSNIDYFNLCSDLKEKFDIEELDVIDINTIFKSNDGVKYLYNFLNGVSNDARYKKISETNVVAYNNIKRIKTEILPRFQKTMNKKVIKNRSEVDR